MGSISSSSASSHVMAVSMHVMLPSADTSHSCSSLFDARADWVVYSEQRRSNNLVVLIMLVVMICIMHESSIFHIGTVRQVFLISGLKVVFCELVVHFPTRLLTNLVNACYF